MGHKTDHSPVCRYLMSDTQFLHPALSHISISQARFPLSNMSDPDSVGPSPMPPLGASISSNAYMTL